MIDSLPGQRKNRMVMMSTITKCLTLKIFSKSALRLL